MRSVEIMARGRVFTNHEIELINLLIIDNGLKGIILPGMYIDEFLGISKKTSLFVTLQMPFDLNSPSARLALVKNYIKEFGRNIKGFGFAPIGTLYDQGRWPEIIKDFEGIVNVCKDNGLETRVIANINRMVNDDDIYRLADVTEQAGINRFICYNSKKTSKETAAILALALKIKKNISIPVGFASNIPNQDAVSNIQNLNIGPIIVTPQNLLKLFGT